MTRHRSNRRKAVKRLPKLPKFTVNWRALLLPPLTIVATLAALLVGKSLLDRPVTALVIEGTFQRVTTIQIEAALASGMMPGFLSMDLSELRGGVESLDWVADARLRRVWPDRLVVRVTEHTAAARWGESGLLNIYGELFTNDAQHPFPELPRLAVPAGSEQEVARLYLAVRDRLAAAQLMLDSLGMDARGALSFVLANGQEVRLGRSDIESRLDRFFDVVTPALVTDFHQVAYVDLRYTNGFAVGWIAKPETEVAKTGKRSSRG